MCQYSADDGRATDWHVIHLGHLALSGAALLTIEATAVVAGGADHAARPRPVVGRDRGGARRAMLESVRRWSDMPIAIQLAHAGRKASTRVPWEGGAQIRARRAGRLADGRAVRRCRSPTASTRRSRSTATGSRRVRDGVRRRRAARRAARPRRGPDPRRARLPAAPVPLAAVQPARRRVRRQPREPDALPARGVRRGARRVPRRSGR